MQIYSPDHQHGPLVNNIMACGETCFDLVSKRSATDWPRPGNFGLTRFWCSHILKTFKILIAQKIVDYLGSELGKCIVEIAPTLGDDPLTPKIVKFSRLSSFLALVVVGIVSFFIRNALLAFSRNWIVCTSHACACSIVCN